MMHGQKNIKLMHYLLTSLSLIAIESELLISLPNKQ